MVSNAQLDNEKTNFMYQVDTLKDALLELEEQLAESRRQYEEKSKVCIQLWHVIQQGKIRGETQKPNMQILGGGNQITIQDLK